MTEVRVRPPTHAEAVAWLLKNDRPSAKAYRSAQLQDWRVQLGDAFADAVEAEVRAKWPKK